MSSLDDKNRDGDLLDHELPRRLAWVQRGAELFFEHLDTIDDAEFSRETALQGWTYAHLVGHLGYNARALSRLLQWARTGVKTPMYASTEARNQEIESAAELSARELRTLARESDAQLRADLAGLSRDAWLTEVVTAQGRPVPAAEIPWMRTREVWVHAVDLRNGVTFEQFPGALLDELLSDITGMWQRREQPPAVRLLPTDRDRSWEVSLPGREQIELSGTAAALVGWGTGRGRAGVSSSTEVPVPGRWL